MLIINEDALTYIVRKAEAAGDREACGWIEGYHAGGADYIAFGARPLENVAADPTKNFEVHPFDVKMLFDAEEAGAFELLGIWHSHPGHFNAFPSPSDEREHNRQIPVHLIVSTIGHQVTDVAAYLAEGVVRGKHRDGRLMTPTPIMVVIRDGIRVEVGEWLNAMSVRWGRL